MAKKSKFKYKVEQSVKFKFYDGSVHNGIIKSRQYRNEDNESLPTQWTMPMYTLHSPDNSGRYSRGYMVYPSITENMIKTGLDTMVKIVPMKNYVEPELQHVSAPLKETDSLEDAIKKQQEFLDGKVKN
tara:strand:- start:95 stop:481 length:387 start_codon:yes stop_codon:yes gene_type:complete